MFISRFFLGVKQIRRAASRDSLDTTGDVQPGGPGGLCIRRQKRIVTIVRLISREDFPLNHSPRANSKICVGLASLR